MKKVMSMVLATALAAGTFAPMTPAFAGDNDRRCRGDWCDRDRDNDRWSFNRGGWDDDDGWHRGRDNDRRWRHHRRDRDRFDGGNAAALVFGLAAGAIASGIATGNNDSYYRCRAEYRSFDPNSWTYLGYDGDRHYCRL